MCNLVLRRQLLFSLLRVVDYDAQPYLLRCCETRIISETTPPIYLKSPDVPIGSRKVRSSQLRFSAVELVVQLQAESAPAEEPATAKKTATKTAKKTEKKEARVVT